LTLLGDPEPVREIGQDNQPLDDGAKLDRSRRQPGKQRNEILGDGGQPAADVLTHEPVHPHSLPVLAPSVVGAESIAPFSGRRAFATALRAAFGRLERSAPEYARRVTELSVVRDGPRSFVVEVHGDRTTRHLVEVPRSLMDDLGLGADDDELLVRTSIMSEFSLDVIEQYFPEYRATLGRAIS
jgi:hypothetical protein